MKIRYAAPTFLLLALAAAPAVAQGIPDNIPDKPGESLADREKDRMEERYRGFFSRFFSVGSLDAAPITESGLGYQLNLNVGLSLPKGDAVLLAVGTRDAVTRLGSVLPEPGQEEAQMYVGAMYELSGTRFLGVSDLARRTALGLGFSVWTGQATVASVELAPTYALLVRDNWSLPVGVRLSLATLGTPSESFTRAFLGFNLGVRWRWAHRDRTED